MCIRPEFAVAPLVKRDISSRIRVKHYNMVILSEPVECTLAEIPAYYW